MLTEVQTFQGNLKIQEPKVSIISPKGHPEAAHVLALAFIDDPLVDIILAKPSDPEKWARLLEIFFKTFLSIRKKMGEPVFGVKVDGKLVGVAMVQIFGRVSIVNLIIRKFFCLPDLIKMIGLIGLWRGIRLWYAFSKNHPKKPHISLLFLGVDPDYHSKGYGSMLLKKLQRFAASSSLAGIYLEAATKYNVAFYRKRGYKALGEISPLGCKMLCMFQPLNVGT